MSISSEIRRAGPFAGNGSTVNFPFVFKVFTTAQVVVTRTVSGVDTTLTLTTHYTVSLNSNQDTSPGGTVTMLTAPASGQSITITSNVANLQPTVLANLGGFYPEVINDSLDRATIQIQQLDERVDRALVVPVSSSGVTTQLPAPEAGKVLGWNGAGNAVVNYTASTVIPPVASAIDALTYTAGDYIEATGVATFRARKLTVDNLTALRAIGSSARFDDMVVWVLGRTVIGDWGLPVAFRFDTANLSTEVAADQMTASEGDGFKYVAPADAKTGASGAWRAEYGDTLLFEYYGAKGDFNYTTETGTDCYAAVQKLLNNAVDGERLTCLPGRFRFTNTLSYSNKHLTWDLSVTSRPLIFENCDGIIVNNSSDAAFRAQTQFLNVLIATTGSGTRTGIRYTGARLTASCPDDVRFVNCHAYGIERIAQRKWSTNPGVIYEYFDWAAGLHVISSDGAVFEDCSVVGREGQQAANYSGLSTRGVIIDDVTGGEFRNPEFVNVVNCLEIRGNSEGTKTVGGFLIGKFGVICDVDDPSNDLGMTGTHIAVTQGYIDFALKSAGTGSAGLNTINGGLFLQIGEQANFRAFKNIGSYTTIANMKLLGSGNRIDHETFHFPNGTIECKIHNNFIRHGGLIYKFDSGSQKNRAFDNVTADDGSNIVVALIQDSGTANVVDQRFGDRTSRYDYHRGAMWYLNAATLSIPHVTDTSVAFDTKLYDTQNFGAVGTTMTIPASLNGKRVRITAKVNWAVSNGGGRHLIILKNGSALWAGCDNQIANCEEPLMTDDPVFQRAVSAVVPVSTGDTFAIRVAQSNIDTAAINLIGEGRCWMQLEVIEA
jgi:hypothetical protein